MDEVLLLQIRGHGSLPEKGSLLSVLGVTCCAGEELKHLGAKDCEIDSGSL